MEQLLQIIGTLFLLVFSALLLVVRYYVPSLLKEAVVLAALYNFVAVVMRILAILGLVSQGEARTLNGLIAAIFVSVIGLSIFINIRTQIKGASN